MHIIDFYPYIYVTFVLPGFKCYITYIICKTSTFQQMIMFHAKIDTKISFFQKR